MSKKRLWGGLTEGWTLCRQIYYFLDASAKFLSLIRFANDLYALYNRLKANTLERFRKTMKTHGISRTQCWTLLVISKATFTKTAFKPKFVDRFSLKNFRAAIDQCVLSNPCILPVHWKLLKLSNVGAKLGEYWSDTIDLAKFLLWDVLLPRVKQNIKYLCSTREFTALACPP